MTAIPVAVACILHDSSPGFQQSFGKPNIEKIYKYFINIYKIKKREGFLSEAAVMLGEILGW